MKCVRCPAALAVLLAMAFTACAVCAADAPYPPAPGHENLPVVFWGHYMPQLGNGQLDANGHSTGGVDLHPFVTAIGPDRVSLYEQNIRYALDAGVNGFQMLTWPMPEMYEAARREHARSGRMFYVNPLWTNNLPADFDKACGIMADFAVAHKDDPHVFRIDGKQVHFFYGVWWAESDSDEKITRAKEALKARGVEVLFIPNGHIRVMPADKILLDRLELGHKAWPAMVAPQPGPLQYLEQTRWDGCSTWHPANVSDTLARALVERVRPYSDRFLFIPAVWPGYDSSNRVFQAIHCPHHGVRVLRDNLRRWVELGFRWFALVTWNDVNETMLLPSTRSPFGFSRILRYYHELAASGKSPFDQPKVVVSYDPEVLYGDNLYVQFLTLPERDAIASDYLCHVRLEDPQGREVASLTARMAVPDERTDAIGEARFDTTPLAGKVEVLSPVVDVFRVDPISGERRPVHQRLRLAPITLRYNKVQFYTSYAIALDQVAADVDLALQWPQEQAAFYRAPTGQIVPIRATLRGSEPLRRLALAESRLMRGAFREDDAAGAVAAGQARVFVRVRSDNGFAFNLALSDGTILERYATKYDWTLAHVLAKIDAPSCEAHSLPHGQNEWSVRMHDNVSKPSFRITASPSSAITLTPKGWSEPVLRTTVAELASGPVVTTARINDVPTTVRLELTLDACEPNMDYPLPAEGQYVRHVAADALHDGTRYFHAWALTASDRIAYSRPIALIRTPAPAAEATVVAPDDPVAAPFIQTRGTFDDFMDESSSVSRNPFTMSDVVHGTIAARLVPYYLYDCEERAGTQLNDSGTAHQCGRAWLVGPHEWIQDGWRGYGLRLKGGRIQLRSKSFPHGPYTFSARVRVAGEAGAAQSLAGDGDYWNEITTEGVRIDLLADGRVRAARKIGASEGLAVSDAALKPGWNHLVVTYDLESLCIYLNGALSARTAVPQPAYQRTHSIPAVGFSKVADAKKDAMVFTGDIDQIEIIGTALDPAAVEQLTQRGQWMSRGGAAPAAAAAR